MAKPKKIQTVKEDIKLNVKVHAINCYRLNDVEVWVKIDYQRQVIDLIENQGALDLSGVKVKEWKFGCRTLEYMNGWQAILDAMKYAIDEASKDLRDYLKNSKNLRDNFKKH